MFVLCVCALLLTCDIFSFFQINPSQHYEEKDEKKILDLVTIEIRKLFSQENSEDNFR